MRNELYHYGIKGQKWGVRRFQNKDGTYTELGRRLRNASRTKYATDKLFNKLSEHDKELLGADKHDKEWMTFEQGEYVVKRILKKYGDIPIGMIEMSKEFNDKKVGISIMTDPNMRGKGIATELAQKGVKWLNDNPDIWEKAYWNVKKENIASRKVAEKVGFRHVKSKKDKDSEWTTYIMKKNR